MSQDRLIELAEIFYVNAEGLPFVYLGVPLGDNPRRKLFWTPMIYKMRRKLSKWRSKFFSISGRLVLLKSVIFAIPIYYMTVFKASIGVVGEFEKIMRSFYGEVMTAIER